MSVRSARHDQLWRHARRGRVVLEAEALEDRRPILSFDVLEVEGVAVDQLAVPEREQLHGGAVAVDRQSDHVDRADGAPVGTLALGQALDREEPVAVPSRILVALLLPQASRIRCSSDRTIERVSPERKSITPSICSPVLLLRDRRDAGRRAPLDVEVEARDPRVAARLRPFTRPELEHTVEHVERLAHLLRIRVRAEVDRAATMPLAREHDPRILVGHGDGDVRKRLVVAQAHVERRPVALDEVLLEMQRLRLGRGDDHLDPADPPDHPLDPQATVAPVEVAAHPGPQRLRLPDVEDVVALVTKEVHARAARERRN